ncbi:hypothetical protein [Rhizobium sp. AP16]|uniref:hypothetical protein n=1 Tax=Rhizobium sp. AP16 TaxID=1144306 RepID=UPI002869C905|nr:hypothetical protein [Rhizobium sp. AP16]
MAYLETLPDQCPPAEALDQAFGPAYRFVDSSAFCVEQYYSHQRLGLPKPSTVDDCHYSSCSLFISKEAAERIARMPKKRETITHLAELHIPIGSGRSKFGKRQHVDFWMYDTFDVSTAITGMFEL